MATMARKIMKPPSVEVLELLAARCAMVSPSSFLKETLNLSSNLYKVVVWIILRVEKLLKTFSFILTLFGVFLSLI